MERVVDAIFFFLIRRGKALILIVSILIFIEGLLYLFFPEKIKKIIENCPPRLFRLAGIIIAVIGAVLLILCGRVLIKF